MSVSSCAVETRAACSASNSDAIRLESPQVREHTCAPSEGFIEALRAVTDRVEIQETLARYAFEQGVTPKQFTADELFPA